MNMKLQYLVGYMRRAAGICALLSCASLASAATYNATIISGTHHSDDPLGGPQLSFKSELMSFGLYENDFIAAVPIPGALWLFGSSLMALGVGRRMARAG